MSTAEARLQQLTDIRLLCLIVAIAIVGDVLTTLHGLSIGLEEGNPFVQSLVETHGLLGILAMKAVVILWVLAIYKLLGEKYAKAALLGAFVPQGVAVVVNVITISQA